MKALRKKLNSRRGASILIALVFLLICGMVGATIVTAASANANKYKGNMAEQQKYFTLSSALTLICDKLKDAGTYTGTYTVGSSATITAQDDTSHTVEITNIHTYSQVPNTSVDPWTGVDGIVPLVDYVNEVVARLFVNQNGVGDDSYTDYISAHDSYYADLCGFDKDEDYNATVINQYLWREASGVTPIAGNRTWTITIEPAGSEIEDPVTVEVTVTAPEELLNSALSDPPTALPGALGIDLKASLVDASGWEYNMYAHLESVGELKAPDKGAGAGLTGTLSWQMQYISRIEGGGTP